MSSFTQTHNAAMSSFSGSVNKKTLRTISAAISSFAAGISRKTLRLLAATPTIWAVTFTDVKSLHSYFQELDAATASFAGLITPLQLSGASLVSFGARLWRTRRFS